MIDDYHRSVQLTGDVVLENESKRERERDRQIDE